MLPRTWITGRKTFTALVCLVALTGTLRASDEPLCRFAVIGDVRPELKAVNRRGPNPVFLRLIDAINRTAPDFTVITGDLIRGGGTPSILGHSEWSGFREAYARFKMPVHLVAGNHDVWDAGSLKFFEKQFGAARYAFEYRGAWFIVLNTFEKFHFRLDPEDQVPELADDQLRWLEQRLERSAGKPAFIFLHAPLWWPNGRTAGPPPAARPASAFWASRVHPLLIRSGNVQAVFGSHEHAYLQEQYDGIRYIISGGGGAERHGTGSSLVGLFPHFLIVTADRDRRKTRIDVESFDGKLADVSLDPSQRAIMRDEIARLNHWPSLPDTRPADLDYRMELKNPFPEPMAVVITPEIEPQSTWQVQPAKADVRIPSEKAVSLVWRFQAGNHANHTPVMRWKIRCGGRQAEGEAKIKVRHR